MHGRIYTRTGDCGETSLHGGRRVGKDDLRVQVYGTVDELQASLGMVRAFVRAPKLHDMVFVIQKDLSLACAELASDAEGLARLSRRLGDAEVTRMEADIDALVGDYGLPQGFIVPGRAPDSAAAHVARTVCRRAERLVVLLNREMRVYDNLCGYLNRLSDLLFALAWALEVQDVAEAAAREIAEGRR
ncbi:Cob(I)yrinic acid a,c-diamide adenosyltransferase [uncultured Alphaproteobacteria bacterium]|uniref:Corrinoid adenosyltransferase n=1 Tax=uncultured Alphaproteobacteria bacterium TaxID=91750 RepID=A0A212IV28_9PROT|nr:Cob(I)yrinic acid a,c-diamide adenosyltransferase [uncultured Alphaproteobacteria bacterium]